MPLLRQIPFRPPAFASAKPPAHVLRAISHFSSLATATNPSATETSSTSISTSDSIPLIPRPNIDRTNLRRYLNNWHFLQEKALWRVHSKSLANGPRNCARFSFRKKIMLQQRKHAAFLKRNPQAAAAERAQLEKKNKHNAAKSTAKHASEEKAYSVPSKASGGVPTADPAYLAQAALPPTLLEAPRRILVVLDLNGTLLYRPSRRQPTSFIERPHAQLFLEYLVKNFVVAVWSSAQPDNVKHMVTHLFGPKQRKKLATVWGRDRFGLSSEDAATRVQVYKRLTRLWGDEEVQKSHPHGGRWDQTNTVLVDDSMEKARSEPFNLVQIPEFDGGDEQTHILPQVHDYLNTLAMQTDISTYINKHPFKQDFGFLLQ